MKSTFPVADARKCGTPVAFFNAVTTPASEEKTGTTCTLLTQWCQGSLLCLAAPHQTTSGMISLSPGLPQHGSRGQSRHPRVQQCRRPI